MLDVRSLLTFSDSRYLIRLFSLLLAVSLLVLFDILLIIEASGVWGSYLVMACISGSGIFLLILALNTISRLNRLMRKKIHRGIYPLREFSGIGGALLAGTLFLFPGAVTNLLGALILLPPIRQIMGRLVARSQQERLKETYQYLKMQEYSRKS